MYLVNDSAFATFGHPNSNWNCKAHAGVTCRGEQEPGGLRIDIVHAKGANWHGELIYAPFPVRAGQRIKLRFMAKAKVPIRFSVWIGQMNSPWASLVSMETHFGEQEMNGDWRTFEHAFEIEHDDDLARLDFVLGVIDNSIWISDVSLR